MKQHRVAVLCGPGLLHRNTCATLIDAGVHVVGICVANPRIAGLPIKYLLKRVRRKGFRYVSSQVSARLLHLALNRRKDGQLLRTIVDAARVDATLARFEGSRSVTHDFEDTAVVSWLKTLRPDVLVVHTSAIIPRSLLTIPTTGLTIGGHPGLAPRYRGSHSAFWAILRGAPEDVGCTVFLIDEGIDRGAILARERIAIGPNDSFVTLGWRGMVRQAQLQAEIVRDLDNGIRPRAERVPVPPNSYFDNPGLRDYLQYRKLRACR